VAAIALLPLVGFGITYVAASGLGDGKSSQDDAQAVGDAATPSSTPSGPASGEARLSQIGEQDKRTAEQKINGKWVVQIGAQKIGSAENGTRVTADSVVDTFEGEKATHPDALLLYTSDWSSYEAQGYWVTVIGKPYDSPEPALQVCDRLGLGSEDCFAKKVSNTVGPDGATRTRG